MEAYKLICRIAEREYADIVGRTSFDNESARIHFTDGSFLEAWDHLWGIYGALGYGGLNGERAEEAVATLKKALTELSKREKIAISGL